LTPVLDDIEHGADILGGELPLMAKHLAELLKDTLRHADSFLRTFDLQGVSPGNNAHVERVSDQSKVLIAATEERDRLIPAIESQR
jgi:hypothetical protein